LLVCFSAVAAAQQFRDYTAPPANAKPKIPCSELRALTGFDLSVISATRIPAAGGVPEHCRVSVMVPPEIGIEVNLPSAWNERLYMFGNGGFAGESFEAPARAANRSGALRHGFATAATDTGHSAANEPGASFARDRQKLLDFGFRSLHVTVETAKLLVRNYYGAAASKSYYSGCSQGGRQGLAFAQRFPNDFDGILAGAPALDQVGGMLSRAYWEKDLAVNPIPAEKLPILARRVYEQCDARDGLKDGLIDDPLRCGFQPSRDLPRCAAGAGSADCFTPAQIASIERIYSDVVIQGKRLFPGWPAGAEAIGPSGESAWLGMAIDRPGRPGSWSFYGEQFLRFIAFPKRDAVNAFAAFDPEKDPREAEWLRAILDATDPDLAAFQRRGGKLLMYFGWADPQLNARMGVEYYENVTRQTGSGTPDFFRLFMVPGMFHCRGGIGTDTFDALTPLIRWVESGAAPAQIPASRVAGQKVVRTRPLCAYPQVARYKGSGSIDDAANFACVNP
jgi:feruloyl esterase